MKGFLFAVAVGVAHAQDAAAAVPAAAAVVSPMATAPAAVSSVANRAGFAPRFGAQTGFAAAPRFNSYAGRVGGAFGGAARVGAARVGAAASPTSCGAIVDPCQCMNQCGWSSTASKCVESSQSQTDCSECPSRCLAAGISPDGASTLSAITPPALTAPQMNRPPMQMPSAPVFAGAQMPNTAGMSAAQAAEAMKASGVTAESLCHKATADPCTCVKVDACGWNTQQNACVASSMATPGADCQVCPKECGGGSSSGNFVNNVMQARHTVNHASVFGNHNVNHALFNGGNSGQSQNIPNTDGMSAEQAAKAMKDAGVTPESLCHKATADPCTCLKVEACGWNTQQNACVAANQATPGADGGCSGGGGGGGNSDGGSSSATPQNMMQQMMMMSAMGLGGNSRNMRKKMMQEVVAHAGEDGGAGMQQMLPMMMMMGNDNDSDDGSGRGMFGGGGSSMMKMMMLSGMGGGNNGGGGLFGGNSGGGNGGGGLFGGNSGGGNGGGGLFGGSNRGNNGGGGLFGGNNGGGGGLFGR